MISWINTLSASQRAWILIFIDSLCAVATLLSGFLLKYPLQELPAIITHFGWLIPLVVLVRVITFRSSGLYVFLWRYASIKELVSIVKAVTLSSLYIMAILFLTEGKGFPKSVLVIDWTLNIMAVGGVRIGLRLYRDYVFSRKQLANTPKNKVNTIIIGAGDAGEMVARELLRVSSSKYNIVGFVDDNTHLGGRNIHRLPVMGTTKDLSLIVKKHKIQEAIIAVPSGDGKTIRRIVSECEKSSLHSMITPALHEIIDGRVAVDQLRKVRIDDLLRRKVVETDVSSIARYISGSSILVTGAGGSIGSELCRQIMSFSPRELILVENCEDHLYQIDLALQKIPKGKSRVTPIIADVKNRARMDQIFQSKTPDVIFHSAAYKQVPLMESNVQEVVLNNVLGTKNVLELAHDYKAKHCVLISTDKAVNTVNCMGATKRLCEVLMQIQARDSDTKFSAVRFGNVLGSRGSVVPLFRRQIEQGGPLTVTHPDITRFFMTITEAVRLVIQTGALCEGGEIFVLDMGDPIKIVDLAKDIIRLSGLEEGKDIDIKYVGLRPGEKLYEELFFSKEDLKETPHKKILITRPYAFNKEEVHRDIEVLLDNCMLQESSTQKELLMSVVEKTQPKKVQKTS
ncbi:polysaccharide biosynthesis protein [bacterium]|jgi:FlaA1/EpsC-like NDP-sugar epimerase|nr:polysaccharide biosynthesis protein [bacterium]